MMREGKGLIVPSKITIRVERSQIRHIREEADRREAFRNYSTGTQWARGLISEPTLAGLVGEFVVLQWLESVTGINFSVDLINRSSGDQGFDAVLFGKRIQIKCRRRDYKKTLIRHASRTGYIFSNTWDYCITCTWPKNNGGAVEPSPLYPDFKVYEMPRVEEVTIDGWFPVSELTPDKVRPAMKGDHTNYEVIDNLLQPLDDFADMVSGLAILHGRMQ